MTIHSVGRHKKYSDFEVFIPEPLMGLDWALTDLDSIKLYGKLERALGILDQYASTHPLLAEVTRCMAVLEGCAILEMSGGELNFAEAFLEKSEISRALRKDWRSLHLFLEAFHDGMQIIQEGQGLDVGALIHLNAILRGKDIRGLNTADIIRNRNRFSGGISFEDAAYIPPNPSELESLITDVDEFIRTSKLPSPILLAWVHYQTETLQMFKEGNGRTNRLFLNLLLLEKGSINYPILGLFNTIKNDAHLYYDRLNGVRKNDDVDSYLRYFLAACHKACQEALAVFKGAEEIKLKTEETLKTYGARSHNLLAVIETFYTNPIQPAHAIVKLNLASKPTIYSAIDELENLGLLVEVTQFQRNKTYVFKDFINLFLKA